MKLIHQLDGIEINEPDNYAEISIELNFDTDANKQSVSLNDYEFGTMDLRNAADGASIIKSYVANPNSLGVIEGKPFTIILDNERGKQYKLFDGYADLWRAKYENGKVTAPVVQTGKIDWVNDYADSFTFQYLYENIAAGQRGHYDSSYFIPVPYCIVKKQDYFEIAMLYVTIFIFVDKIEVQIKNIAQLVSGSINPFELTSLPRLIIEILYLIVLFISLIPLIVKFVELTVPPIKFHNCMYVKDLFAIACDYMGFTFKSSILLSEPFDKMVIMPEKYNLTFNKGAISFIEGDLKNNNEKVGYYKGSFGDLIRSMKIMFNAKIVISDGIFYFENYNFQLGNQGITIPDQYDSEFNYTYNHDDYFATLIVAFLTDLSDRHTIAEYMGTSIEVQQLPKVVNNIQMSLARNEYNARIQFALGKTKTSLTNIEKILSGFITATQAILNAVILGINIAIIAINILIALINKVINFMKTIGIKLNIKIDPIKKIKPLSLKNGITNRIGMLKMESDYVQVPKIFLIEKSSKPINTKMHPQNDSIVNAEYLFDNYHSQKLFIQQGSQPNNQFLLKSLDQMPFSFADYETVLNNSSIFTSTGKEGILISLKFNPITQTASVQYKIRETYLYNLQLTKSVPNGD